jgi:hypothetical protein
MVTKFVTLKMYAMNCVHLIYLDAFIADSLLLTSQQSI